MPIYNAAGITVRLSTTDAALSTSKTIAARTGPQSKHNLQHLEAVLDVATNLPEQDVEDDNGDAGLRFVGDAGTPFLLKAVRVGCGGSSKGAGVQLVSDEEITKEMANRLGVSLGSDSGLSSLGPTPATTPLYTPFGDNISDIDELNADDVGSPPSTAKYKTGIHAETNAGADLSPQKALSLSIKLDPNRSFKRAGYHATHLDIKVDVFMNGHFISSTRCPASSRNQSHTQNLRFSGLRIDRNIEKAWLLNDNFVLPSEKPKSDCNILLAAVERWRDISTAIKREADKFGFDRKGHRPPVGEYLASLSQEQMPYSVSRLPNFKENKYSVVDLVISLGAGKKYPVTAGYLAAPLRLEDKDYGPFQEDLDMHKETLCEMVNRDLENQQFFDMHPAIEALRTRLIAAVSQPSRDNLVAEDTPGNQMLKPPSKEDQHQYQHRSGLADISQETHLSDRSKKELSEPHQLSDALETRISRSESGPMSVHEICQQVSSHAEERVAHNLEEEGNMGVPGHGRHSTRSASIASYDRSMIEIHSDLGKLLGNSVAGEVKPSQIINRIVLEMGGVLVRDIKPKKPLQILLRPKNANTTQHGLPRDIEPPRDFKEAVDGRPVPVLSIPDPRKRRSSSPLKHEVPLLSPSEPSLIHGNLEGSIRGVGSSSPDHLVTHSTSDATPKRKRSSGKLSKNKQQKTKQEEALWRKSFDIPELSKHCVVTYAADAGQGLRQCRGERAGDFKEVEVLLGVRFLVAGTKANE